MAWAASRAGRRGRRKHRRRTSGPGSREANPTSRLARGSCRACHRGRTRSGGSGPAQLTRPRLGPSSVRLNAHPGRSRQRLRPTRFSFCRDPRGRGLARAGTGHLPRVTGCSPEAETEVATVPEQVWSELDTLAEIRSRAGSDTTIRSFYDEILSARERNTAERGRCFQRVKAGSHASITDVAQLASSALEYSRVACR